MERAYTIAPQEPYRICVLRLWICPERGLVILNCNIRDDNAWEVPWMIPVDF